ncbi:MAG: hypothetical protein ACI9GW_000114 [Halieaceae bacterium]|jgi:hypothetical protein
MTSAAVERRRVVLFCALLALVAIGKLFIVVELELFGDEAFYWLEAQRPALAYSDLPFSTSMLVAAGTALVGDNHFGVRLLFLLLGTALPLAVLYLAQPIVGTRDGLYAATFSLCIPMAAGLGILAIPDVPLVVLSVVLLGVFERALRTGLTRYWLAAGALNALGLCIHYRFALFLAAALLFLLVTKKGRAQWRGTGVWYALLLTLPGFWPLLHFNLQNRFGGILFHFSERHAWQFHVEGLGYWWQQALLVTPLIYGLLLWGFTRTVRAGVQGDWQAAMLSLFAALYFFGFGLVAPWADQRSTTLHWPFFGYMVMLVFLPATLRELRTRVSIRYRPWTSVAVMASGMLGVVGVLGYFAITAFADTLPPAMAARGSSKMIGWHDLGEKTSSLIARVEGTGPALIVTGDYHDAAQIAFALKADSPASLHTVYSTDTDRAVRDGRVLQLALWQRDERALLEKLQSEGGNPAALVVVRDQQASGGFIPEHQFLQLTARYCALFRGRLVSLGQLQTGGDKPRRYEFLATDYSDEIQATEKRDLGPTGYCQPAATALIQSPGRRARVRGVVEVFGFAFQVHGVEQVKLMIDGRTVGATVYGEERRDLRAIHFPDLADPNRPHLGFRLLWDSSSVSPGIHEIAIKVTASDGKVGVFSRWPITVVR